MPLLEEMAEEDEEFDLYNEMTFGLGKISGEAQCWGDQPAPNGVSMMGGVGVVRKLFSCLVRSWIEIRDPSGHCPGFHPPQRALLPSSKTEAPLRRTLQNS